MLSWIKQLTHQQVNMAVHGLRLMCTQCTSHIKALFSKQHLKTNSL